MNQKADEKKTAIKLINKYADSYNLLEEENKSLRSEINDLKINLKINKEIISGFFNLKNQNDKINFYIKKITEENEHLNLLAERTTKEKDELRTKLTTAEELSNDALIKEREENEKNKNKIFIIENAITKKDNIILGLKKKLDRFNEYEEGRISNYFEKEIIISEPSIALNNIHDELMLYKNCYDNLSVHFKQNKISLMKYEALVNDLTNENSKLRTKLRIQEVNQYEDISYNYATQPNKTFKKKRNLSQNITSNKKNIKGNVDSEDEIYKNSCNKSDLKKNAKEKNKSENKEEYNAKIQAKIKEKSTEEWIEIMKIIGLTLEEFDSFLNNKNLSKLIEALELLNRLLNDKNLQIKILEEENENLNSKNFNLNKENIFLFQQNIELKKHVEKYMDKNHNRINNLETNESSLLNNISKRNTSNNLIQKLNSKDNSTTNLNITNNLSRNKTAQSANKVFDSTNIQNEIIDEINYSNLDDHALVYNNNLNKNKDKNNSSSYIFQNNQKNRSIINDRTTSSKFLANQKELDNESIGKKNSKISSNPKDSEKNENKSKNINEDDFNSRNIKTFKDDLIVVSKLKNSEDVDFSIEIETNSNVYNKNINSINNYVGKNFDFQAKISRNQGKDVRNLDKQKNTKEKYLNTIDQSQVEKSHNRCNTMNNYEFKILNSEFNKNNLILKSPNKNNDIKKNVDNLNNYNNRNPKISIIENNSCMKNNQDISQSFCEENFNSSIKYIPCKTIDNMENSKINYNSIKRNIIDDMDSIIHNNIEKLFNNNINTKQISKSNVFMGGNNMKNDIKNKEYNSESKYLDESESCYDEVNNSNVNQINQDDNNNFNNKINKSSNINNFNSKIRNNYESSSHFRESSEIDEFSDSKIEENFSKEFSNDFHKADVKNSKYNSKNQTNFKNDNKNDNNGFNTNKLLQNHKIQNNKYINTNLNKENKKLNNLETDAENTIKFGNTFEFKENLNASGSFMSSSNIEDIGKFDIIIKNSNS